MKMLGPLLCEFWFPGKPAGKGRAQFVVRPRKGAGSIFQGGLKWYPMKSLYCVARPATNAHREQEMRAEILSQMPRMKPYDGAVSVIWTAFYPPLKGDSRIVTAAKIAGEVARLKKPDLDNIEKMILDASNTYIFSDDAQVTFSAGAKVNSRHEGVRVQFYETDTAELHRWTEANFPFEEEEFELKG